MKSLRSAPTREVGLSKLAKRSCGRAITSSGPYTRAPGQISAAAHKTRRKGERGGEF